MALKISKGALDWALAHIEKLGDTDIFPNAFEFVAVRHDWDDVKEFLVGEDLRKWTPRSHRRCLSPKGRFSYRIASQLDPLDALIFAALVYEIGERLESYRISANERVVFSHRFLPTPDGRLYDSSSNWGVFIERCKELSDTARVSHVVIADIADFFPRLYHHRIENTLGAATGNAPHVKVIVKMLSSWSEGGASYGLPVGPAACRILADTTIDDVDQNLRTEGAVFCRYSDDYRIFCSSPRDAYEKLELLASLLHKDHGLTLQQGKTAIVTAGDFKERYLSSPPLEELNNLYAQFRELLQVLGITDAYESIDYEDLDPQNQALVDELNLEDLLGQQMNAPEIEIGVMKFVLRRLAQLDDADVVDDLLEGAEHCYPVIAHIVKYLAALSSLPAASRASIGARIVELARNSVVGHLPYHRCWFLSLFAGSREWNQDSEFVPLYNSLSDSLSRRELILALGRSSQDFWFRPKKTDVLDYEPWLRRAFLAAASCLPSDERRHWYNSLRARLDPLEQAVVKWARANPF